MAQRARRRPRRRADGSSARRGLRHPGRASPALTVHSSVAYLQRSRKAHPGGRSSTDGVIPGICASRMPRALRAGTESSRPCVYGCHGWASTSTRRPLLDDPARVHDADTVREPGDHRQVVRDPDHRRAGLARELLHLEQDLALDRHVERRGRLVGDDEVGIVEQRDRDRDALAHAAGELVRVRLQPLVGRRDADLHQRGARPLERRRRARPFRARGSSRPSARRCAGPGSASSSGPGRSSRCGCRAAGACPRRTARRDRGPSSSMRPGDDASPADRRGP